ncbi:hypothetical protein AAG906_014288 [Vitis piasezkii]
MSPRSEENLSSSDDVWLTVSDILSLHNPPVLHHLQDPSSKTNSSFKGRNRTRNNVDGHAEGLYGDEFETNSVAAAASAAAMKEAMDRADAKFRHAKGVRREKVQKLLEVKKLASWIEMRKQCRMLRREQSEKTGEIRTRCKGDKFQESKEKEGERENRGDLRRRGSKQGRLRGKGKGQTKCVERAAVHRAQAEARERAAAEAKERAEKAAAEAKERTNTEAREKEARERTAVARAEAEVRLRTKRAAVERVVAEARERAAAEARERAATRVNQQKNENDLESFFSMSSRPSSAPRPRANFSDPMFGIQFQNRHGPEMARTSASASSTMRKASPTTNIVDDLSSIFEVAFFPKARLERHQRTQEHAAKALAEKNQWDLQT